jgi:hypothetical protein
MTARYSRRKAIEGNACIGAEGLVGNGRVLDLSVPGCLLETGLHLKMGQSLRLRIPPSRLGEAIRRAGLSDLPAFVNRIVTEVLPVVERVRDEITAQFPKAAYFVKEDYPIQLENSLLGLYPRTP